VLTRSSFFWTLRTSKYFKLLTFLASQSCGRIARAVEIERNLFLGKCIITMSPATYIKLDTTLHAKSHHFSLMLLRFPTLIHYSLRLTTFCSTMSSEADQASNITGDNPTAGSHNAPGTGSNTASSTSSSTMADQAMARKEVPSLYQY
jgi:hypothetical protein